MFTVTVPQPFKDAGVYEFKSRVDAQTFMKIWYRLHPMAGMLEYKESYEVI